MFVFLNSTYSDIKSNAILQLKLINRTLLIKIISMKITMKQRNFKITENKKY